MNVSKDEELLGLLADSNFDTLFIGIETPNVESLREANKLHNVRSDLTADIHKILSYGLVIRAGLIVGFDHDDDTIFDIQYDFILKSFLPSVAINMLKAPAGTKLWARLREEGRVVIIPAGVRDMLGHPRSYTTIIPKQMTRIDLMKGYRGLLERVVSWQSFAKRIRGFISVVQRFPKNIETPQAQEVDVIVSGLKVGRDGRKVMEDIIVAAAKKAPVLLGRVKALIVQHAKYRESIKKLLPQIDRQIELESTGKLVFEIDKRPILVPSAFRKSYRTIFQAIYHRVFLNLKDKDQTSSALVEVFVDFLTRWGVGFTELKQHHQSFLNEICDRTCAKFNGQPPEEFVPVESGDRLVPFKGKYLYLGDDILKTVEQVLTQTRSTAVR
jgi:hypothetical protein